MGRLEDLEPSLIVPGPAADGLSAVVGWRIDDREGYHLRYAYGSSELLFEAELPEQQLSSANRDAFKRPAIDIRYSRCGRRSRACNVLIAVRGS